MSVASQRPRTLALVAAMLVAPIAQSAYAQDVQYTTNTKIDLGGGMNAVLKLAGASEVKENTYIKGKKLRSDAEKTSTIFDVENGRFISIDHSAKTYTSVPIADMAAGATAMAR